MKQQIKIGETTIGVGLPVYIVAEISANHNQDIQKAVRLIQEAKKAGVDAIKLQTYTADTMTIDSPNSYFKVPGGTLWEGRTLYDLYKEAYTPWEWHPQLFKVARDLGLTIFSTPFDSSAVDFLESLNVPAYKIASFELVDIPLIRKIAQTKKPIIMSTGMATQQEIQLALDTIKKEGNDQVILLKCTSAYPAPYEEMNLKAISTMRDIFKCSIGLSDHTMGSLVPIAATALGICLLEKHVTLSRSEKGPDSAFSLEPQELKQMVLDIRNAEKSLGHSHLEITDSQKISLTFRKSIFVVADIKKGELFNERNIRCIRPGHGLAPKYWDEIIGKAATKDISKATPLDWSLINQ